MANKRRRGVVTGQRVTPRKVAFSRELRSRMTPAEALLWERLRGGRLGGLKFRRQQIISGYIADFYCDSAGLVVEVDGPIHERQREYDERRDAAMRERGLRVLRVPNAAVLNEIDALLAQIEQLCRAA
jgi:very-short-patch-repair endonuclease